MNHVRLHKRGELAWCKTIHPIVRHESTEPVNNSDEVNVAYMLEVTVFVPTNVPEVWVERREFDRVVLFFVLHQEIQLQE